MSQKNTIAVVIPAAQLTVINGLITQLKTALAPYIHALTKDEIKGIAKMGDKTVAFVDKVKDYTVSNPEFVPTNMINVTDFNVDVNAVNVLSPVSKSVNQIAGDLEDTLMLCGNEALIPALIYYGNVKFNANNGVASAKTIYEDLKQRFPGRGKSNKSTPNG
jgi:phage major head subunit gpT-like protein